jgi:hypothetical protein
MVSQAEDSCIAGVLGKGILSPQCCSFWQWNLYTFSFTKLKNLGYSRNFVQGTTSYSLYTDDTTLFIHPSERELLISEYILQLFVAASGLVINMAKTKYYPIQCGDINLEFLTAADRVLSSLPCTYLGLPLDTKKKTFQGHAPYAYSKNFK